MDVEDLETFIYDACDVLQHEMLSSSCVSAVILD